MTVQPIKLYTHPGPNPFKVAIVLEELGLPYEYKAVPTPELKQPEFTKINPNGRVPAIEDPNTNVTLWESAAIIEYLVDTYDQEKRLTYTTSPLKYQVSQWLYFQMSGQGPYFGQAAWFAMWHPEKLPSAIERYRKEVLRVVGVLNSHLEGKEFVVGDKLTIADLAFLTWNRMIPLCLGDTMPDMAASFPAFHRWNSNMLERPAVAKIMKQMPDPTKIPQKK